ncbi:MAG: hypothetical protein RIR00_360 [Pseudomonadota bacterium]
MKAWNPCKAAAVEEGLEAVLSFPATSFSEGGYTLDWASSDELIAMAEQRSDPLLHELADRLRHALADRKQLRQQLRSI